MHLWVLEVGVGVLKFHGIRVKDCLPVFNLANREVTFLEFLVQLEVPILDVIFADVSQEDRTLHTDSPSVVLVLRLLYLGHLDFVLIEPL